MHLSYDWTWTDCKHCVWIGGKKRSIPFRRQRMQIDELLPPSSGPTPAVVAQPDDPYIADLLQVADDRIQELQQDVTKLQVDLERTQAGIKHLNTQVNRVCNPTHIVNNMLRIYTY